MYLNANANVFYVSTKKFTNDLVAPILTDGMQSFWENYWDIDILLVNNIKFIEWKE
ncbi:DnaA ATPase domain-containing protein [Richelia intracellularis]|uniref:DnaA ATPase domain-containing protein n=1 Tax=Richelia intracellularis TaxID=1164990 RepID=UPI0038B696A0